MEKNKNNEKQVVIFKTTKEGLVKYWINKETINDIYSKPEYSHALKYLLNISREINDGKVELEIKLMNLEDIQLESFNEKIRNSYNVQEVSTLEKFILNYAEELSGKVDNTYIASLLRSIGSGDSIKEKEVIFRGMNEAFLGWRRQRRLNKINR